MKCNKTNRLQRWLSLAGCGLMAAAIAGCAEEIAETFGTDRTSIEVAVAFDNSRDDSVGAVTRAADNLNNNTNGFGQLYASSAPGSSSKVKVMIDNGSYSYSAYTYRVTAAKAITAESTAPYFPGGVNTVNVYGWYPYTSGTDFSIQTNQSTNGYYCISDLMLAQPTTCMRGYVSSTWTVTPASLSFKHVMSKILITVNTGAGVTVNSITLGNGNIYPTVPISTTTSGSKVTAVSAGTAKGTKTSVTVFSGSLAANSTGTYAAVIPAQSISGTFITVNATPSGQSAGNIVYTLGSAKTFAQDTTYPVTLDISANQVGQTIDISDWASTTGECTIGGGGDAPTLSPTSLTLTYGGSNGTITPTLTGASTFSGVSSNTGIATVSGTSTLTVVPVAPGTCTINVFPTNKTGAFSSATCEVTVNKAAQSVSLSESSVSIYGLNHTKTFTVTRSGNGTITAASSNTSIATTSVNQSTGVVTVTGKAAGSATITVTVAEGTNHLAYTASDKNVSVSVVEWDRNGAALSTATSDDIGVAVTTDGKLYYNKTTADAAGKTIVGVLAYSGSTGHGYIVALKNSAKANRSTINGYTAYSGSIASASGSKLVPSGSYNGLSSYTTLGSTAVSNWVVLTKDQYTNMWNQFGGATNGTYNSTSNGYITDAGGTALSDFFYSCTPYGSGCWGYYRNGWGSNVDAFGVRPVLAF